MNIQIDPLLNPYYWAQGMDDTAFSPEELKAYREISRQNIHSSNHKQADDRQGVGNRSRHSLRQM